MALALVTAAPSPLRAAEPLRAGRGWFSVGMGAGQVERKMPGFSDTSTRFYLGFGGGVAVDPHLLLGIEISGWLIQAENADDPSEGAGISRAFVVARIYPQANSTFHFHVGAGSVTGWDNSPSGANHTGSTRCTRRSGSGWEVGAGYDAMLGRHSALTPFLRYSSGTAGDLKTNAVTAGLSYTWR
jgi:hypothetical protein